MTAMEWAERTYEGPDGKSYATLISGGAMSVELHDLTVEHIFTPFQLDGESGSRLGTIARSAAWVRCRISRFLSRAFKARRRLTFP